MVRKQKTLALYRAEQLSLSQRPLRPTAPWMINVLCKHMHAFVQQKQFPAKKQIILVFA
jgi:hypothetical protein